MSIKDLCDSTCCLQFAWEVTWLTQLYVFLNPKELYLWILRHSSHWFQSSIDIDNWAKNWNIFARFVVHRHYSSDIHLWKGKSRGFGICAKLGGIVFFMTSWAIKADFHINFFFMNWIAISSIATSIPTKRRRWQDKNFKGWIWLNCYCWGDSSMVEGRFSKWF